MNRCPSTIGTIFVIAWFLACSAAATPPSVNNLTGLTSFAQQQLQDIADYTQYWFDEMTSTEEGAAAGVAAARRRLLEPARLSTTEFRLEYSNALVPLLEKAVAGDNQHWAVNALTVLQELSTDRALMAAIHFCDKSNEQRMPIRLMATRVCRKLMTGRNVSATRIRTALRALVTAVEAEDDGIVLRRQLEALLSVNDLEARSRLAEALNVVVGRFNDESEVPKTDMLRAIDSVLPDLRHAYLNLRGPEQTELGRELAGPLVTTLGLAQAQWDRAHKEPEKLKELYSRIILISEQILKQIDPRVRPGAQTPTTTLHETWVNADKDRFDADFRRWRSVVRPPAYDLR